MIDIQLLNDKAKVPTRSTTGAAAFDLYATEDILIIPGTSEVVPTGIAMKIPEGWFGLLTHRSSMAFRGDCIASLGIIDSDFTAEVKIKMFNLGAEGIHIKAGERVAQIAFIESYQGTQLKVVEQLPSTKRGAGGFGSTGK